MFVKIPRIHETRSGGTEVLARVRELLSREDWVYLLSLLVPMFLYNVALKVVRVVTQFDAPGPVGFLDQVRSDLLFNLGYAALWIGLFAVVRSRVGRMILLFLFHLLTVLVVALSTSAHLFYEKTGSMLDLGFVVVSVSRYGEVQEVVASEVTIWHWLLISVILFYAIAGPTVITRIVTGDFYSPVDPPGQHGTAVWNAPVAACGAALLFFTLSLLPSATGAGNAFSRDALANMLVGEIAKPEIKTELAAGELPTNTKLVPTQETEKLNVVMVFLESTRARSTTPYNEDIDTTPFLDEFSKESLMAEHAYTVVPHTSKALVAAMCGVAPPLDDENTESEPGVIPARCIPELLEEQGYRSVHFQSATEDFERRRMLIENIGQEDFYPVEAMDRAGFQEANYFGYEDDVMLEPSRTWLEANGDQPFLASYLTVTPHHDYVVPDRYGTEKFAEDEELNKYLNTVRYQDFFLRNLIEQYQDLGLYDDTIFVVLGDHGEGFDEHGLKQHDNTIYNEGLHIPLLIRDPRQPEARTLEPNVDELDLLPTVADMLGYKIGGGTYPGYSIFDLPEDRTLMASCYHEGACLASIHGDQKYIYFYGNNGEEYYDLSEDPHEKNNIIDQQDDEKIDVLRENLLAWEARIKATYEQRLQQDESTSSG